MFLPLLKVSKKIFKPFLFCLPIILSLLLFLFSQKVFIRAQSEPQATATSFTVSDQTPGATNVTYTFEFTINQEIQADNYTMNFNLNRITAKNSWEGGDQTSNMTAATGTVSSFQYNSGSGWQDIDYGGASYFHKEISSEGKLIWGFGYADDQNVKRIQTTIPANSSIRLVMREVTNPSKPGAYALSVETGQGPLSSIFWLLPAGRFDGTHNDQGRARYVDIYDSNNPYCLKIKVKDPSGTNTVAKAQINVHNLDWSINTPWGLPTYADGSRSYYPDDFWYIGGSSQNTCPTGAMIIEAHPPMGVIDYARSADKTITLPTDKDKYYNEAITLSAIQVSGTLKNPAGTGDYANVKNANVSFRPSDFNPTGFKNTVSDSTTGEFKMGGLGEGIYYIEFSMPWQSGYEGITSPDPIQIEVNSNGEVKTISGSTACSSFTPSCSLGNINYKVATKRITGRVIDQDGNAVTNGKVRAFKEMGMGWAEDELDSEGNYSLTIGGGTWGVMPEPTWMYGQPPGWTFCGMPRFFTFANNEDPEEKTAANTNNQTNFTVKRATITVIGNVVYPDGSPFTSGGGVEIRSKEGCGSFAPLDPSNGQFSTVVAPGTYNLFIQLWSQNYSAPPSQAITVASSPYNVGTLTLIEKKDTISGRVWTDINGNGSYDSGEGVSRVRISAFKMTKKFDEFSGPGGGPGGPMGGGDYVDTTSDNNGVYSLKVTPGTWMVNAMADPGMMGGYSETQTNYIYNGMPIQVNVAPSTTGNTYPDRNFKVLAANATIKGKLVDEAGNGISGVWGFAYADSGSGPMMGPGMGAPIQNGIFTLKVPAGTYNVGVEFPPETSGYTPASETSVTVGAGETTSVNVTAKPNNRRIKISFIDTNGNPVTSLSRAEIFADNGSGGHIFKMLYGSDLATGSTTIAVCEGTWSIGYFIDPTENNYMSEPISKDNKVTVTSANDATNPATINVTLRSADSTISGIVTDPSGNPLAGVWISTDNRKASDFALGGPMFMLGNVSDADGHYSISVPAGKYVVQAFLPPSIGYINPEGVEVTVSPTSPATVNLQFAQSDATITGSVYLSGTKKGAFVSAYSSKGGYSETNAASGDFSLNVTKDDTWYLKAMYEYGNDFYQSAVYKVDMGGATSKSQDLTLTKASFTLPDAVSSTFDYRNAKKITLSNGFSISIPAGAISPTSNAKGNNITITISPTAQLSTQNKSIPIGIGYEITAVDDSGSLITSNFNDNVTITIPYTEEYLREALGITDESMLDNGYWDTTTFTWKEITGATIDTVNNTISFAINHFTTFSILAARDPVVREETADVTPTPVTTTTTTTTTTAAESKPAVYKTGGIIEREGNQVVLMIPSGALKWDADFEITKTDSGFKKPKPPLWIASGPFKVVMKAWFNSAKFYDFETPVILILRYDPLALGGIPENSLRLNYYDEIKDRWRPISSLLIKDRDEVAAVIDKIQSTYALIGGYGYQGAPSVVEETVTAVTKSEEIGLDEELLPKREIKEEVTQPLEETKPPIPKALPKKEGFFSRLLKKIFFFIPFIQ